MRNLLERNPLPPHDCVDPLAGVGVDECRVGRIVLEWMCVCRAGALNEHADGGGDACRGEGHVSGVVKRRPQGILVERWDGGFCTSRV